MTRGEAVRVVLRPALFVLWSFVAWGHLLLVATLVAGIGTGLAPAFGRLVPARGGALWAWLNLCSVLLAVVAWLVALAVRAARRAPAPRDADSQRRS